MIIHGNKQISEIVYARKASECGGAVRLTNMIRGAQVVFGGLAPNVKWLKAATTQSILAAFGQDDGYAVLGATNAYLNALAATDPTKASALAGFINEDTMLVCSLGLQPQGVQMPIRWLVGDGTAYIKTNIWGIRNMTTEVTACKAIWRTEQEAFTGCDGSKDGTTSYIVHSGYIVLRYQNVVQALTPTSYIRGTFTDYYNKHTYKADATTFYIDGAKFGSSTNVQYDTGGWLQVFKYSEFKSLQCNIKEVKFTTDKEYKLIPFVSKTQGGGMIDMTSFTFYPNANTSGSFSIEYTLPDGTPWTPLNQTP